MANKDPAFLFYSSDFLVGVSDLTMEERGQYITLICLQHQKGHLNEKTICLSLGLSMDKVSEDVLKKFKKDENDCYYHQRVEEEIQKRLNYNASRKENGSKGGRPKKPYEKPHGLPYEKPHAKACENHTENVNVNVNVNKDIIKDIVNYLNNVLGTSYKHTTVKTKDSITARLKEGFALEDFKKVIDKKSAEWKDDLKMSNYLRPETLFGNKFEGYLNQLEKSKGFVYNNEKSEGYKGL